MALPSLMIGKLSGGPCAKLHRDTEYGYRNERASGKVGKAGSGTGEKVGATMRKLTDRLERLEQVMQASNAPTISST
jgi:hypothetical protein